MIGHGAVTGEGGGRRRTRPLRVLHVVPDLAPGGAERHVTTTLPRLDRSRFDARVVCIGDEGRLFADLAAAGIPARALRRTRRQALRALIELVREMRAFRPDVVIVRGYNAEALGRVAAVLARVPRVVVWMHDCAGTDTRSELRRAMDLLLEPVTDAYFGVAEVQVDYIVEKLGHPRHKVHVILNGVNLSAFDAADRRTAPGARDASPGHGVVGIVASLLPVKNHELFLDAAQIVVNRHPEARFLIVGDGPRRAALEHRVRVSGLTECVSFTGDCADVNAVLCEMDVFVLCSHSECFPIALLEAMAAGLPAVCTAVGGVPEIVVDGETGTLTEPGDSAALADGIGALLEAPDLRSRYGAAARCRVAEKLTLDRSVARAELALITVAGAARCDRAPIRLTVVLDEAAVGGVETVLLAMFRAFDPHAVVPRLICLRDGGGLAGEFRASGFEVVALGRTGRSDLRTLPRLVAELRRDRTDAVLVTHHHRAALALGRAAALVARVPVNLVAVHDMGLTGVGGRCLPRWAAATLFASSALVLLSERQDEYLAREEGVGAHRWSSVRTVVVENGIPMPALPSRSDRNSARVLLGLPADTFVVGIVARLSAQKAHEVLFSAFARLAEVQRNAMLVVIGGGPREGELRILADRMGISARTQFTGLRRDVDVLLPALDVSCLSSVHEGVPMTVIESMARGLPIVATDCGCLSEMVADGVEGFIVDVGDTGAMADRLIRLAADPGLRRRMGARSRERAEQRYRVEDTAQGYTRLLHELLDGDAEVPA